jgi:hypothetical protein
MPEDSSAPGKMVLLVASPLGQRWWPLASSCSGGRRTEICHWTLLVCDHGVTRDTLAKLNLSGPSSDPFRLGLLFELRRTTKSHYELQSMPGITAQRFVYEFPVCSVYFAGVTQREETDIIKMGIVLQPPGR